MADRDSRPAFGGVFHGRSFLCGQHVADFMNGSQGPSDVVPNQLQDNASARRSEVCSMTLVVVISLPPGGREIRDAIATLRSQPHLVANLNAGRRRDEAVHGGMLKNSSDFQCLLVDGRHVRCLP